VKCGSKKDLEFHHIIPDKMISSNGPKNLQLLCRSCNRMKGVD
jgi:5-methylcytosine-specific restriction endonuclease McrA